MVGCVDDGEGSLIFPVLCAPVPCRLKLTGETLAGAEQECSVSTYPRTLLEACPHPLDSRQSQKVRTYNVLDKGRVCSLFNRFLLFEDIQTKWSQK